MKVHFAGNVSIGSIWMSIGSKIKYNNIFFFQEQARSKAEPHYLNHKIYLSGLLQGTVTNKGSK